MFAKLQKFAGFAADKLATIERIAAVDEKYLPALEELLPPLIAAVETENLPAATASLEQFYQRVKAIQAAKPQPAAQ